MTLSPGASDQDEGASELQQKLARRTRVATRALAVGEERPFAPGRVLVRGSRERAGEPYGYVLVLCVLVLLRTSERIDSFEGARCGR